jgi:hypothetical protein
MLVILITPLNTHVLLRAGQQGETGRQLGQWQVKAHISGRQTRIQFGKSHKLANYVGYNVAKASLL